MCCLTMLIILCFTVFATNDSSFDTLGIGILYMLFLAFILFQSYKDVREMMFFLDPSLKDQGPDTEVGEVVY